MSKQFRLSIKIAFGFLVLIAILVAMGMYTVKKLRDIQRCSVDETEQALPLLQDSMKIERLSFATMAGDLRYQLTSDNRQVGLIATNMMAVKAAIDDTLHLATQYSLYNKQQLARLARAAADDYSEQLQLIADQVEKIAGLRKQMEQNEERFQSACRALNAAQSRTSLKSLDDLVGRTLAAASTNAPVNKDNLMAELQTHLKKGVGFRDLMDLSRDAHVAMQQADIQRDPILGTAALANLSTINARLDELKVTLDADNLLAVEECRRAARDYRTAIESLVAAWKIQQSYRAKCEDASSQMMREAREIADHGIVQVHDSSQNVVTAVGEAFLSIGVGTLLAVVAGSLFSVILSRSITKPINQIISGLSISAEQVASVSNQVTSSSQQLAQGSSEQASNLEETSASLEEMASMTRQNAENATKTDKLMDEAKSMVLDGVASMKSVSAAIEAIRRSTYETTKIIKTIDEIAFQINLLALNAAVEAARAGDAGRGFAVVADEVRNLARRSAEAARNTAGLIEGSQKNAESGVQASARMAESLDKIQESALKVAGLLAEITAASRQQAQGIEQVNVAVSEMDKVVQHNAAGAEESASAAQELSAQAQELNMLVVELTELVRGSEAAAHAGNRIPPHGGARVVSLHHPDPTQLLNSPPIAGGDRKPTTPEKAIPLDDHELKQF
jgi:methyl-accepting chemotaxis protein